MWEAKSKYLSCDIYEGGPKIFRPDVQKPRKMENTIYGQVNVSVLVYVEIKGYYIENYQRCFISVALNGGQA
jgi:hypothetical protein